jgi:uncharacterized protein YndB with AHSA1/START domain
VLETEAFSISRDLKAPRALVYEVQTDAKHLARITISWRPYNSDEAGIRAFDAGRASMTGGFAGVFKKLEAYLAQLQG